MISEANPLVSSDSVQININVEFLKLFSTKNYQSNCGVVQCTKKKVGGTSRFDLQPFPFLKIDDNSKEVIMSKGLRRL